MTLGFSPCYHRAALEKPQKMKGDPFLIAFGIYGGVGFQLAASVVGGLLIGNLLDQRWNTRPWLAMTGLILGSVGGFYNLLKILDWNQKRKQHGNKPRDRHPAKPIGGGPGTK